MATESPGVGLGEGGYLTKCGERPKSSWKRRWFAVEGDALKYKERPEASKAKGSIPLADITAVVRARDCGRVRWPISDSTRCFGIVTERRTYTVYADSVQEAYRWRVDLNCQLVQRQDVNDLSLRLAAAELHDLAGCGPTCRSQITAHPKVLDRLSVASLTGKDEELRHNAAAALSAMDPGEEVLSPIGRIAAAVSSSEDEEATVVLESGHGRSGHEPVQVQLAEVADTVSSVWAAVDQQVATATPAADLSEKNRKGWRTVRVFVSSTFTDMFSEREVLVGRVFPRLRAWCEPRQIRLIECDLRWGVPKEATSEDVFRTCLGEIDRCRDMNGNPFFINLLGARYGWVPNEVPPSVNTEFQWILSTSVTHMEIQHGALRSGNPNAAFFVRDDAVYDSIPQPHLPSFVEDTPYAVAAMAELKRQLRQRFPGQVVDYSPSVSGVEVISGMEKVHLAGLEAFAEEVYDFLTSAIERQYPVSDTPMTPLEELRQAHEDYRRAKDEFAVGRDAEVDQVLEYVAASGKEGVRERPMLVAGPLGSGRATVLACAAREAQARGFTVVFHSMRAISAVAAEMDSVLTRLVLELGDESQIKSLEDSESKPPVATLAKLAAAAVESAGKSSASPVMMVLDGLEELAPDVLKHLPLFSSGKVRLVASADRGKEAEGGIFSVLSYFDECKMPDASGEEQPPVHLVLQPLSAQYGKEIVQEYLGRFNKELDEGQMSALLSNEGARLPGWIMLAVEELRVFGIFELVTRRVSELAPSIHGLMSQTLTRIDDGSDERTLLLRRALKYITLANRGLHEAEIRDLLGVWEGEGRDRTITPLPLAVWAPIAFQIRSLVNTTTMLSISSRSVHQLIRQHYVGADKARFRDGLMPMEARHVLSYFKFCSDAERRREEYPFAVAWLKDRAESADLYADRELMCRVPFGISRTVISQLKCGGFIPFDPKPEVLCMGCSFKSTFNPRLPNKMVCFQCRNLAHGMNQRALYRCQRHSKGHQHGPQHCIACGMVAAMNTTPVVLCMSCEPFDNQQAKRCGHVGL